MLASAGLSASRAEELVGQNDEGVVAQVFGIEASLPDDGFSGMSYSLDVSQLQFLLNAGGEFTLAEARALVVKFSSTPSTLRIGVDGIVCILLCEKRKGGRGSVDGAESREEYGGGGGGGGHRSSHPFPNRPSSAHRPSSANRSRPSSASSERDRVVLGENSDSRRMIETITEGDDKQPSSSKKSTRNKKSSKKKKKHKDHDGRIDGRSSNSNSASSLHGAPALGGYNSNSGGSLGGNNETGSFEYI